MMAMVFFVASLLAWTAAAEVFRFANTGLNKKGCLVASDVVVLPGVAVLLLVMALPVVAPTRPLFVAGSVVALRVPDSDAVARSADWIVGAD